MKEYLIDINADLGEGQSTDANIMPLISSCSIACGGHYGDEETMRATIKLAKENGVKIGAHPSFPDKDHFGRKRMTLTKRELTDAIFNQLLAFYAVCEEEDMPIHHLKLHGALYNYSAIDAPTADAVISAMEETQLRSKLYVPNDSIIAKKAENLFPLVYEAFIDRRYTDELTLVSRDKENALITDPKEAWQQLFDMVVHQELTTITNNKKKILASTYCIHGDTPQAQDILDYIHIQMKKHNLRLT
jgi:UPF0271 protein